MNIRMKGFSTIDRDLSGVFKHGFLRATSDASHHEIYRFRSRYENGDISVPTFGKETELFGWDFEGAETLSETPIWFESRVRIGKALWDNAVMDSMSYYVSREVLRDVKSDDDFYKDPEKLREYVIHQMELSAYYEQVRFAAKKIKSLFEQQNEKVPYLIYWNQSENRTQFFGVYSINPNEYEPKEISHEISNLIENEFLKPSRDLIKTQDQLPVGICGRKEK